MHKHLMKKSVTAALVAGGLLGLAAQSAQADGILFPYLSTQAGVYSFVTVVNDAVGSSNSYHFTYGHKTAPVANRGNCEHFDGDVGTTLNDMMTFHVRGTILEPGAAGYALFEAAGDGAGAGAGGLTSTPLPLRVDNQIAFLGVEHNGSEPDSTAVNLFGWAEVIDTGANLSLAYSTHNFVDASAYAMADRANFANLSTGAVVLSWYPTTMVTTSWHVLELAVIGSASGSMSPASGSFLRRGYTVSGTYNNSTNGGAYDRDELFWSGSKTTRIRCFGIVNRGDLLGSGVDANTVSGGWTYLVGANAGSAPPNDAQDPDGSYSSAGTNYLVHKIQAATSAAGVGARMAINREPSKAPTFTP